MTAAHCAIKEIGGNKHLYKIFKNWNGDKEADMRGKKFFIRKKEGFKGHFWSLPIDLNIKGHVSKSNYYRKVKRVISYTCCPVQTDLFSYSKIYSFSDPDV